MTPAEGGLAGLDRARILATNYYVPVGPDGSVFLLEVDSVPIVLTFTAEAQLPAEAPPGSVGWLLLIGHLLVDALPTGSFLWVGPDGRLVSADELRAPIIELIAWARGGQLSLLREPFGQAVLYCPAGETPGFLADDSGAIEVFSSLQALRQRRGDVAWFSTTGAELLELLPAGHRFVLDPGSPHEAVIRPT